MASSSPLPRPATDVMFQQFDDGAVLFSASQEVYFGLNTVGATVWNLLPGAADLTGLCDAVAERHPGADAATIRRDVRALLADLEREGLVVPAGTDAAGAAADPGA